MRLTSLAAVLVLGVATATLPACASDDPVPAVQAGPSAVPTVTATAEQSAAPTGRDGLGARARRA
ncbi:hypothetical protein JM949_21895, partial [Micromonospora sp. STR1s_6]|nr:hypothetical protein [Micromonospora tarensis]